MKLIKIIAIAILTISVMGCKPSTDKKETPATVNLPAKLLTVSIDIEGMTCEIGCAKTIESKISKMEGVTESKVNFEEKKGIFVYDSNTISKEEIISTINHLVDGKTYTAKEADGVKKSCQKKCCENKATSCAKEHAATCKDKQKEDGEKACCATKG